MSIQDALSPATFAQSFLAKLESILMLMEFKGVVVRTYVVSHVIKDGELSQSPQDLLKYAHAAAREVAGSILLPDDYVYPAEIETPLGSLASSASTRNLRAVVVMSYDSKTAGTRITFKV